jgi:hypothetical protein
MGPAAQRIRDKLWYGILPNVRPLKTRSGHGTGHRLCDGCDVTIWPKRGWSDVALPRCVREPVASAEVGASTISLHEGPVAERPYEAIRYTALTGWKILAHPLSTTRGRAPAPPHPSLAPPRCRRR